MGLDRLTKLNKQRFKDPPTMHSLVRLFDAVHEETAVRHNVCCIVAMGRCLPHGVLDTDGFQIALFPPSATPRGKV